MLHHGDGVLKVMSHIEILPNVSLCARGKKFSFGFLSLGTTFAENLRPCSCLVIIRVLGNLFTCGQPWHVTVYTCVYRASPRRRLLFKFCCCLRHFRWKVPTCDYGTICRPGTNLHYVLALQPCIPTSFCTNGVLFCYASGQKTS